MIRLVKTVGGDSGTPHTCKCGAAHFIKTGPAWHCTECGNYYPLDFSDKHHTKNLIDNLNKLTALHKRLRFMVDDLERIVK